MFPRMNMNLRNENVTLMAGEKHVGKVGEVYRRSPFEQTYTIKYVLTAVVNVLN